MNRHPLVCAALALSLHASAAGAVDWHGQLSVGSDFTLSPEPGAHEFVLFDVRGRGAVGRGDLRLYFNTDTLQASVENVPLGTDALQFSAGVRGELAIAGLLRDYFRDGRRVDGRGFFASYVYGYAALKWLPAMSHSLELQAAGRAWIFARDTGGTSPNLRLPTDPRVFEARLRYTFWRVTSPGDEWQSQVLFPRVTGLATGVELGMDLRSDASAWGALDGVDDGRNHPGDVIVMARQWLRAGAQLSPRWRVQVDETASWGSGEDDLTRNRVGGMNPYVVPIPGLPWAAVLSERLVTAQVSVHVRPWLRWRSELGVLVSGGAFNDPRRTGALMEFGALGGAAVFADLRVWRLQVYLRAGWAFPVAGLTDGARVTGLAAVGLPLF